MSKRGFTKKAMLDQIATAFGEMGIGEVSIGGMTLKTKPPKTLPRLDGYGDDLVPGDWFKDVGKHGDDTIFELLKVVDGSDGTVHVLARDVSDVRDDVGPTSMAVEGPGWRRVFKKVQRS